MKKAAPAKNNPKAMAAAEAASQIVTFAFTRSDNLNRDE
jgi:hypothetical protein